MGIKSNNYKERVIYDEIKKKKKKRRKKKKIK